MRWVAANAVSVVAADLPNSPKVLSVPIERIPNTRSGQLDDGNKMSVDSRLSLRERSRYIQRLLLRQACDRTCIARCIACSTSLLIWLRSDRLGAQRIESRT